MEIILNIKRQESKRKKPYYQKFIASAQKNDTVIATIRRLNERNELRDAYGKKTSYIGVEDESSLRDSEKCAITINGEEVVASETLIGDFCNRDGDMMIIEPRKDYAVIHDLITVSKGANVTESAEDDE